MLKCSSRCIFPVRVRPFLIMLIIAVIALSLHAGKASATVYFKTEYMRHDLPVSQIKKGSVVGSVYLKAQRVTFSTRTRSFPNAGRISLAMNSLYNPNPSYPPDPGCVPDDRALSRNSGLGLLRNTASGVEAVCSNSPASPFLNGLTLTATGAYSYVIDGIVYEQTVLLPRVKLYDVVVNDPIKALSMAGRSVTMIPSALRTSMYYEGSSFVDEFYSYDPVSFWIGETKPAAFFPQQNSSHALLPLPVKPSGDLATGSASVDLCLYDGAGLTTSRYMLTFQDQNTANTSPYFAVYNNSGTGKMDYSVSLTDPSGTPQPVTNRTPFFWSNMQNGGAAQSRLKYVQLPDGIQGLVPCVPSVVTVKVKPVPYKSLRAGNYTGHLNILFTPSTN
ncbi:CfaE/CblD family pilus tip adhesin [Pantoea ananatis]|uniref:CfaE/CblD family pilus tip adhesin n=1 Tax=Pantoea ananas TaxID=553 RepID=UPI0025CB645F|nr:CfaE/CblD family pilus tip adhesin [Pantoea ananatis]MDN4130051.1 CfaE/CblD family pilus tip adhesin [Pantoea ananatis]MDN4153270.1 CfaE/CblD family pilus tip adhesin [Pantoea ananatis]